MAYCIGALDLQIKEIDERNRLEQEQLIIKNQNHSGNNGNNGGNNGINNGIIDLEGGEFIGENERNERKGNGNGSNITNEIMSAIGSGTHDKNNNKNFRAFLI